MPRVTVQDENGVVYMSEIVHPDLLDRLEYAEPWLERLCWALWDALPEGERVIQEGPIQFPLSRTARQRLSEAIHRNPHL